MSIMLSVHDLSIKTLAGEIIVYPTSFQLHAGEALTIVGETGSGKTLIAQAIANNLPEDLVAEGEIYLCELPIHELPSSERNALWGETLCVLPQEPMRALDPTMKSINQVREGYRLVKKLNHREANHQANTDFKQMSLGDAKHKYPHELSGGMAQRVAFLAARSGGATFTIADEPTKGLDASKRDEVSKQLRALIDNNEGVLTITHDIEVAQKLGGRVIIMKDGNVVEQGTSDAVFNSPCEAYTKKLINADPKFWEKRHLVTNYDELILEVKNLAKSRGEKQLFKEVTFSLHANQIIGVSGDSGCGKSTLGDMLLKLLPTDTGKISWKGDTKGKPNLFAQKIFQDPSDVFSPHVTLQRSFNDVIKKYKIEEPKIDEWLTAMKLDTTLIERYPNQVSGGELQRLAIARVMLMNPSFIFADEPTSRLDMLTQQSVIDALCDVVKHSNIAMMIVSHDKVLLDKVCDSVVTL